MKSFSYAELVHFSEHLNSELTGSQLQEVWTYDQGLVMQFYSRQELFLWIHCFNPMPMMGLLKSRPAWHKKQKPLGLFLNSHAKNLRWLNSFVRIEKGRVVEVQLSSPQKSCELEIQLIPRAMNILVQSEGKKISWNKPRELPQSDNLENVQESKQKKENFDSQTDWFQISEAFYQATIEKKEVVSKVSKDPRIRALEKKQKALSEMQSIDFDEKILRWIELGEALKFPDFGDDSVLKKFEEIYDSKLSRSQNRENAFAKAKALKAKKEGHLSRIQILKQQIEELTSALNQPEQNFLSKNEESSHLNKSQILLKKTMKKVDFRGRKQLISEKVEAFMGKSGKDNLALLRMAQSSDLWMHLKDEPSAHVILMKPKSYQLTLGEIEKAAKWLFKETINSKKRIAAGTYEFVVVECRYVRPIKGDKLGRVTYHHPQFYRFAFSFASN